MKDLPILFNGDMVRAILAGRKSMTRRPIKPQPRWEEVPQPSIKDSSLFCGRYCVGNVYGELGPDYSVEVDEARSPFGGVGAHLYVRETWRIVGWHEGMPMLIEYKADSAQLEESGGDIDWDEDRYIQYLIDCTDDCLAAGFVANEEGVFDMPDDDIPTRWRPSIHMPKWASRITLEVTREWAERVHEISEPSAIAEGCELAKGYEELAMAFFKQPHRQVFMEIWDDIYAAKGFGWDSNPWVFGCEFKVLEVKR